MSNIIDIKCPGCNGNIVYNPLNTNFLCTYCNKTYNIDELNIKEFELDKYKCTSCGAEIILNENEVKETCPYCGNDTIIKSRLSNEYKPNYILPFKTNKEEIINQFKILVKEKKQIDDNFIMNMKIKSIKPMYVPFFLYSFNLSCNVKVKDTSDSIVVSDRKVKVNLVDAPIDGSIKLDDDTMSSLFPFDLSELKEYNHAYLLGYNAEMYDEPKEKLSNKVEQAAKKTIIKYYRLKGFDCNIQTSYVNNKIIKYILLPVWIIDVEFEGKIIKFYMNGQTSELIAKTNYNTINPIYIILIILLFFISINLFYYNYILCFILIILDAVLIVKLIVNKSKKLVEDKYNLKLIKSTSIVKEEIYR